MILFTDILMRVESVLYYNGFRRHYSGFRIPYHHYIICYEDNQICFEYVPKCNCKIHNRVTIVLETYDDNFDDIIFKVIHDSKTLHEIVYLQKFSELKVQIASDKNCELCGYNKKLI